jgi:hypothetical protein
MYGIGAQTENFYLKKILLSGDVILNFLLPLWGGREGLFPPLLRRGARCEAGTKTKKPSF